MEMLRGREGERGKEREQEGLECEDTKDNKWRRREGQPFFTLLSPSYYSFIESLPPTASPSELIITMPLSLALDYD